MCVCVSCCESALFCLTTEPVLLQAEALGMEKFLVPDSPAAVRVVRAARERLAWLHVGLNAYPKPQLSEHF